ncbi:kelch-like protein 41 [Sitodiplosis mosellana]|uniref:kelch-like protein 41 n=1 Tax=Sitodiplosis mosellana TaxID=263140 RepID=UPI00244505C4|nr:kelch-like protein 41 [Sitodiplosis mosellana]XP_055325981.1 kelch-like protein 41 [Sitodiplosis mosellana]
MSRRRIVYNYPSSEDSLSPEEKRFRRDCWENRMKRLETGDESDSKIIVGDKTIRTHKVYLTDFPYFKQKFGSQKKFREDECDQINISEYEYAIVYEMVKYMYSLKVNISTENVEDLLKISDEYHVDGLFKKAQKFMVDRIETGNVIDCLILTEHITNAKLLKSASIDYILNHYFELDGNESWENLSSDLSKQILRHEKLNQRIPDINAENADQLLAMAEKCHVKKLTEAVKKFKNQV